MLFMRTYIFCASVRLGVILISIFALVYPEISTFFLQLYSIGHGIACVVAGYGAYNLKRYFVLPLAFFEFVFIVEIIVIAVLFLRIIRHFVSLEKLIVLTVTAAAYASAYSIYLSLSPCLYLLLSFYLSRYISFPHSVAPTLPHSISLYPSIYLFLPVSFVVYDFFALLAFEQIMRIVRSKQYQQLYGSDPLNPVINATTVKYPNANNSISTADKSPSSAY
ncbi:uncharacterized protein LOC26528387 [Drosophila mojavensis]|uniref:uncharacterized protein LOC26528387 n=1 Tax=Drosophila mojavensis TaxID=7230 RepID=UPI001CD09CC7|nr:uncharacterized protein LOC26528387 [Drosophila mojavensis]